jgi:hypothetical protein
MFAGCDISTIEKLKQTMTLVCFIEIALGTSVAPLAFLSPLVP